MNEAQENLQKAESRRPSALSIAGIQQHRRGTLVVPRQSSYVEEGVLLPPSTASVVHSNVFSKRVPWVENAQKRNISTKIKGKLVLEGHFPVDFRGLYCARFVPEENRFVLSYGAGVIQAWTLESNEHCAYIREAPEQGFPITCIRFIPKTIDNYFAASACGTLFLGTTKPGQYMRFAKEENNEINSVDCNATGDTAITVGKDASVRVYDIPTKKLITTLCKHSSMKEPQALKFHTMRVFTIKCHPQNKDIFLTGGWDDCVKIWDARVKEGCIRNIKGPHICGEAIDIRDSVILTGSWVVKKSLQLWDLHSGNLIATISPHNRRSSIDGEFLYCAHYFAGDLSGNTVVVGGSGLSNVEIIDINENKVVSYFKIRKSIQAIDSNSKYLIFGGMESIFRLATYQL